MTITAEQAQALKSGITPGPWNLDECGQILSKTRRWDNGVEHVDFRYPNVIGQITDNWDQIPNASAIAAMPDMLDTIVAQAARIAELEARENEWRSAFWVADQFAVAIHDDAGKFYSIRARDFHRMSDLYRRDISAARAALNGERT